MRIALYCQNVFGVGHLQRSLNIAAELCQQHEVHFIQGGPKVNLSFKNPHFYHHYLSPLLMSLEGELYSPLEQNVSETFAQRSTELAEIANRAAFDLLIVEFFPFGRYQFKDEVLHFLELLKFYSPGLKAICSMRDIYTHKTKAGKFEKRAHFAVATLNQYFDHLLIHADKSFLAFDESFPYLQDLKIPFSYTGFVVPKAATSTSEKDPFLVVVSMGGGPWGEKLQQEAVEAARLLPHFQFICFGAALGENTKDLSISTPNIIFKPFDSASFKETLARAGYSIGLAGYNSVFEAINFKTYLLLAPFPSNNEQPMRANKVEQHGLGTVLEGERLRDKIVQVLGKVGATTSSHSLISLNGSAQTLQIINKLFSS